MEAKSLVKVTQDWHKQKMFGKKYVYTDCIGHRLATCCRSICPSSPLTSSAFLSISWHPEILRDRAQHKHFPVCSEFSLNCPIFTRQA